MKLSAIALKTGLMLLVSVPTFLGTGVLLISAFPSLANPDGEWSDTKLNSDRSGVGFRYLNPTYDRVKLPSQIAQYRPQNNTFVAEIARGVTVRILANNGGGSGVIIDRQGQVYTVLTCAHVIDEKSTSYTILAPDGANYLASLVRTNQFGNKDLALVKFVSDRAFRVVAIGDSKALGIGDEVYASGFPNWYLVNQNEIENTRSWGLRAFRFTTGNVGMMPERSLPKGYQLGYTNEIEDGMSGGPVLNSNGELVGINGRLKFPPQGIRVYRFADGTSPSQALFQRMEALSWAIPITNF